MRAVGLGLIYGTAIFAAGFVLGALRTTVVAPHTGDIAAVMVEVPVMLAFASAVAGRLVRRGARLGPVQALVAGAVALASLWLLEAAMATLLLGVAVTEVPLLFLAPAGQIGLAAQAIAALFPLLRR